MNDIRRTILWVIFGFSLVLLWDKWQVHSGKKATFFPAPAVATAPAPETGKAPGDASVPSAAAAATAGAGEVPGGAAAAPEDRESTRLNSSQLVNSDAVFCFQ